MSDCVDLIDGNGTVIGTCRSVSPAFDQGDRTVVQLDEWAPNAVVEVDYRIIDPYTIDGAYRTQKHTRYVTEWQPDE